MKKKLEPLAHDVKATIASFLVHTANADGVVSREEVRLLEKVYRMLGIDPQRLYTDLHQHASGAAITPAGVKHVRKPAHAPRPVAVKHEFVLDATRIAALKEETARVSSMLADVFVEEAHGAVTAVHIHETAQSAAVEERDMLAAQATAAVHDKALAEQFAETPAPEPQAESESTLQTSEASGPLLGLDDAHSSFLRLLVTRGSWTRAELADAASHLELMLDGAIEQVNEASLDRWDEPLTDGDDPVEINQEVAQRLAA